MAAEHPNDPLHGITLENLLTQLVDYYGWKKMGKYVRINCFQNEPSITSSLRFLRKNNWAREEVEDLYFRMLHEKDLKKSE